TILRFRGSGGGGGGSSSNSAMLQLKFGMAGVGGSGRNGASSTAGMEAQRQREMRQQMLSGAADAQELLDADMSDVTNGLAARGLRFQWKKLRLLLRHRLYPFTTDIRQIEARFGATGTRASDSERRIAGGAKDGGIRGEATMAQWKAPVERFLEFLRLRTVSGEGRSGSYQEVRGFVFRLITAGACRLTIAVSNVCLLLLIEPSSVRNGFARIWKSAQVLDDGRIYGRGAQDMKNVCIQYVEAVHQLMVSGFTPKRNIYLLFVPDEEIGGAEGMDVFLDTKQFKSIGPIAFAFDEGLANPGDAFTVFYGERSTWWAYVKAKGPTGHGSRFIKNTATSKIIDICNKALAFRDEQEKALGADTGCKHGDIKKKKLGDVTTVNISALQSGVSRDGGKTHALNVIPTEAIAGFDIRISPGMDIKAMEAMLDEWCAAEGVSWEFAHWTIPLKEHYTTSLDAENVWWQLFQKSCARIGETVETEIFPAATDSRYLRKMGVPAIGFSPMKRTEILLHEHNESLHKDTFLHGIDVYVAIFQDMFAHV
ncbi:hypothetical protein BBJ28_00021904, partial [Nothophytophthora sp. Chile5]